MTGELPQGGDPNNKQHALVVKKRFTKSNVSRQSKSISLQRISSYM